MGHSGLTNAFHDQDATPHHVLAKADPNQANIKANEYYHLTIARELLLDDATGLLSKPHHGDELRAEVDSLVETLIRATDPATQSNYLRVLHARLAAEEPLNVDSANQEDRKLVRNDSLPTMNTTLQYLLLHIDMRSCYSWLPVIIFYLLRSAK